MKEDRRHITLELQKLDYEPDFIREIMGARIKWENIKCLKKTWQFKIIFSYLKNSIERRHFKRKENRIYHQHTYFHGNPKEHFF